MSASQTGALLAAVLGPDYQVGDLIGAGGFAEVFTAFDRRLKRQVAVKVLREEHRGNAGLQERFRREAEAIAQLRHPHIIPVYAVGESQGLAYFVMPLLEGETLAAAIEREPRWSFPEVCRILREAASGLAEAHRAGLIHRDVKPENIFLDGPSRRVVIMDFGIAKAIDEKATGLTATGLLIGSPQFMSPEQAVGEPVDALSDQYSLALVGYRLLAGRPAFEAESARALLFKQANVLPPPLEDHRPDVPASLNAVILRGLSKERGERFPTIGEFEAALTRVAAEVAGDFKRQRAPAPLRERWTRALAVLYDRPWRWVAAVVLGLLVFGVTYPMGQSRGARVALGGRERALAVARQWLDSLGVVGGLESRWNAATPGAYRAYQEEMPPKAADSAAAARGVWYWLVSRSRSEPEQYGSAGTTVEGRLSSLFIDVPDSVPGARLSGDSALALASAFARARGYDPAELGEPRRSQRDLVSRQDHTFEWRLPSTGEMRVGLSGDRVTRFGVDTPEPPRSAYVLSSAANQAVAGLGGVITLVMVFLGLGIAARRAAFDTIQWGTTFRLAVMFLTVSFLGFVLPGIPPLSAPLVSVENLGTISRSITLDFLAGNMIGPFGMLLVLVATAESWLNESRPDLLDGLGSISRLQLRTPELLQALPAGLGFGVVLAAARAVLGAAGSTLLHLPVSHRTAIPQLAPRLEWPALGVLSDIGVPVMAFGFTAFLVALAVRRRQPWLAPVGMALLWTVFSVTVRTSSIMTWEAVLEGVIAGLAAMVMMRHGVVAGGIAILLATFLPVEYDLLWAGGPFLWAGVLLGLLLLAPVLLGALIYRRRPT